MASVASLPYSERNLSRLRAQLRERVRAGWTRERLHRWLDDNVSSFTSAEIRFGRVIVDGSESFSERRYS